MLERLVYFATTDLGWLSGAGRYLKSLFHYIFWVTHHAVKKFLKISTKGKKNKIERYLSIVMV